MVLIAIVLDPQGYNQSIDDCSVLYKPYTSTQWVVEKIMIWGLSCLWWFLASDVDQSSQFTVKAWICVLRIGAEFE